MEHLLQGLNGVDAPGPQKERLKIRSLSLQRSCR